MLPSLMSSLSCWRPSRPQAVIVVNLKLKTPTVALPALATMTDFLRYFSVLTVDNVIPRTLCTVCAKVYVFDCIDIVYLCYSSISNLTGFKASHLL